MKGNNEFERNDIAIDREMEVLEGMKNHPMEYDDRMIRKILRCVVVQTKQRIKVIFIDGLEIEVEVEQ